MPEDEFNKYLPDNDLTGYWLNLFKLELYYDI